MNLPQTIFYVGSFKTTSNPHVQSTHWTFSTEVTRIHWKKVEKLQVIWISNMNRGGGEVDLFVSVRTVTQNHEQQLLLKVKCCCSCFWNESGDKKYDFTHSAKRFVFEFKLILVCVALMLRGIDQLGSGLLGIQRVSPRTSPRTQLLWGRCSHKLKKLSCVPVMFVTQLLRVDSVLDWTRQTMLMYLDQTELHQLISWWLELDDFCLIIFAWSVHASSTSLSLSTEKQRKQLVQSLK